MRTIKNAVMAGSAAALLSSSAFGASITFNNETYEYGTGKGAVATIVALQDSPSEGGSVLRNLTNTADVKSGDVKPGAGSKTWSIEELAANTPDPVIVSKDSFGVVFNIAEPGSASDVALDDFRLVFYSYDPLDENQQTGSFTATYDAPVGGQNLTVAGQGVGGSGYLFRVVFESAAEEAWFNNPKNRVGIETLGDIANTAGSQETFYIAAPAAVVPLPHSATMGAALLTVLGVWRLVSRVRRGRSD